MDAATIQNLQLGLTALNVLAVFPALAAVGRYMLKLEIRMAKLEWTINRSEHGELHHHPEK